MINRHFKKGQKLDVAGLNQMIVLLDRGETEMTEVALNEWRAGLTGPPHKHNEKEQIFYVTSGIGQVVVGAEKFDVKTGSLIYIPTGVVHQTIAQRNEPLCYMLFNLFITREKEGHASFAEHIEKVKNIRKRQAESGNSAVEGAEQSAAVRTPGKFISDPFNGTTFDFGSNEEIIVLDRSETGKCECTVQRWPAKTKGAVIVDQMREQTLFILSGKGCLTIGTETEDVIPGNLIFVPRSMPYQTETTDQELTYLCVSGLITEPADASFEGMYLRIAPGRIQRWKAGNSSAGE